MLLDKPKSYPMVHKVSKVQGVMVRRHILNMLDGKLAEMSACSKQIL